MGFLPSSDVGLYKVIFPPVTQISLFPFFILWIRKLKIHKRWNKFIWGTAFLILCSLWTKCSRGILKYFTFSWLEKVPFNLISFICFCNHFLLRQRKDLFLLQILFIYVFLSGNQNHRGPVDLAAVLSLVWPWLPWTICVLLVEPDPRTPLQRRGERVANNNSNSKKTLRWHASGDRCFSVMCRVLPGLLQGVCLVSW